MNLSFNAAIAQLPVESAREALRILLAPHFNPVFGAAKTVEHEVTAFSALQLLGFLNTPAEPFELITKLRVAAAQVRVNTFDFATCSTKTDETPSLL
ncbi:MAG TPA: hypothetical protein DCP03_15505 [Polaromonas sp.]|uniref:hypothetical protein n=1 Tax=Polaromonas sp. UBA4122 TaxID=1947074 RepID=UPI000EDAF8EA|nr:hypothetical protein [Polaromonas sp. UBA4122]HAL39434.1 hypothetical protein [Polaromonas sp.]